MFIPVWVIVFIGVFLFLQFPEFRYSVFGIGVVWLAWQVLKCIFWCVCLLGWYLLNTIDKIISNIHLPASNIHLSNNVELFLGVIAAIFLYGSIIYGLIRKLIKKTEKNTQEYIEKLK